MSDWLNRLWYGSSNWRFIMWPLSLIYRAIIFLRYYAYQAKIFNTKKFPVPIIVVGNITAGGTGKTPIVIELVQQLTQLGFNPGVVSRGYGGATKYPVSIDKSTDAKISGDEPLLIATKTNAPVVVSPNRVEAVQKLLDQFQCDVVISDDGLQHYALIRDIEIAIVDVERQHGNGYCLPAGPLREPVSRLKTVDFVLQNGIDFTLELTNAYQIDDPSKIMPISAFQQTVHAVAGIGNPDRFFRQLSDLGLNIMKHPFPDHHQFTENNLDFGDNAPILMTEKDAVKCRAFSNNAIWVVPATTALNTDIIDKILIKLGEKHEKFLQSTPA